MWAMLVGWVVREKMTRLGSQALGSWGMEGPGPHQRGGNTGSWHGPTLPSSVGLCSLMCVLGRGTELTGLP